MHREEKGTGQRAVTHTLRIYKRPMVSHNGAKFLEKAALWMMFSAVVCALWMIGIAAFEIYKKFGG